MSFDGDVYWRDDGGYEETRQASVFNLRKPDRYPDVIVLAESEQDVVAAVRLARERGLKVKVRGGGHSWTASSLRDGGMLIDSSGFQEITVDPEARTATVTPSVPGRALNEALAEHGLYFPTGHCSTIGLGGFLLQGGFGWNGRALGPACASLRAIDVVTAGGELIRSDDATNPDFVWAARGSGPGFFGAVTRFHLDVYPLPEQILLSAYSYPVELAEEVLRWWMEIDPSLAAPLDLLGFITTPRLPGGAPGTGSPVLTIAASAWLDREQEALDALDALETCPVLEQALVWQVGLPTSLPELYTLVDEEEPEGWRYSVDSMWTVAGADELLPQLADTISSIPSPMSHVLWMPWVEREVPNGVFSMQASLYVALVSVWEDEREDARLMAWPVDHMRRLEPLSKGIQLADENLIARPWPFLAPEKLERLEELRARHDPDGLFHSYLIAS